MSAMFMALQESAVTAAEAVQMAERGAGGRRSSGFTPGETRRT